MALFDFTEAGRQVTIEEIVLLATMLTKELGGSVVFDAADIEVARRSNKTISIFNHNDPWQLVVKVVDN